MKQIGKYNKSKKPDQILAAAETLYTRYGFRRVSVEEICQKAEVSKMTFYKYFSNKDDLFKAMVTRWYDESVAKIEEIEAMPIPFPEKIQLMMQLKKDVLSQMSEEFMDDYIHPAPELQAFMQDFYTKGIAVFIEFIKRAQATGEVRREMRPEFLIAILNKIIELAKDPALAKLYPSTMELSLEVNNFIFCGILPLEKVGAARA